MSGKLIYILYIYYKFGINETLRFHNTTIYRLFQDNLGLYRDDAIIKNANGHTLDNLRKIIIRIFKNEGLKITIETNLSSTEFLDVTLDLRNNKYYPYRK